LRAVLIGVLREGGGCALGTGTVSLPAGSDTPVTRASGRTEMPGGHRVAIP